MQIFKSCCLCLVALLVLPNAVQGQTPDGQIFASEIITSGTNGGRARIDVDISGAKELYLVVANGGDGFNFDWCDWINPKLVGVDSELKLTDLDWKHAEAGWGSVQKNLNCSGQHLAIGGEIFKNGIGTHSDSVIHFELPANHKFKRFKTLAGLDDGGTRQESSQSYASVRFLVFTKRPPTKFWVGRSQNPSRVDHSLEGVLTQFDVHPEVEISLFAAEPMLVNPSNIDIDHLGRVWVCEVVNYRGKRNTRAKGDRILVLEDTDHDGAADKQTVFYQGRDIDSAHGICVLGNRVLVSAGSEVFYLNDPDGDLKANSKDVLFTKISGVQHDHGIHAFVFGPDGKLYFNFGNEGRQICDKSGNPIFDVAGQEVRADGKPYREGMIFRCNLDGSEFETLAWNFRNNWEVCIDSFGRLWQSDNDDDGNRATRINFVMPFGNYGFRDEVTGAGWREPRTGMSKDVPRKHWHQNDPGVVPNLLITGAGSPTGICIYEGDLLPKVFHNQIIHCDAGPNIVRAYPVEKNGAGFSAKTVNLMDGAKQNQWFRPSDVCVAPDGSLLVSDWYDPGVGGHGMGDVERGRLFRVTKKGMTGYRFDLPDFNTPAAATEALQSPNQATRFLAWQALHKFGAAAIDDLKALAKSDNPRFRARAIWLLTKIDVSLLTTFKCENEDEFDAFLVQLNRQQKASATDNLEKRLIKFANSDSAHVRREVLLSLNHKNLNKVSTDFRARTWTNLAGKYKPGDRWYLEALGIAADGHWEECMAALQTQKQIKSAQLDDLVWRSRSVKTPEMLARTITKSAQSPEVADRYLRAFDFFPASVRDTSLKELVTSVDPFNGPLAKHVFTEAASRIDNVSSDENISRQIDLLLEKSESPNEFVELMSKFNIQSRYPQLLELAAANHDNQSGVDAISLLLKDGLTGIVSEQLKNSEATNFENLTRVLEKNRSAKAMIVLRDFALSARNPVERRKRAVLGMGKFHPGNKALMRWVQQGKYDERLEPAISAALHNARWPEFRALAQAKFPMPKGKDDRPIPTIEQLMRRVGNAANGKKVFAEQGTCAKCHVVNGEGVQVGPELSEIGDKLSRPALFETILFPSAGISNGYEQWLIATEEGSFFSGVLTSESDSEVVIKDAEGIERRIPVDSIEDRKMQTLSLMPADLHKLVTEQELVDVVEYMMTLKK